VTSDSRMNQKISVT